MVKNIDFKLETDTPGNEDKRDVGKHTQCIEEGSNSAKDEEVC